MPQWPLPAMWCYTSQPILQMVLIVCPDCQLWTLMTTPPPCPPKRPHNRYKELWLLLKTYKIITCIYKPISHKSLVDGITSSSSNNMRVGWRTQVPISYPHVWTSSQQERVTVGHSQVHAIDRVTRSLKHKHTAVSRNVLLSVTPRSHIYYISQSDPKPGRNKYRASPQLQWSAFCHWLVFSAIFPFLFQDCEFCLNCE